MNNRMKQILNFIRQFINDNGYPPSVREIGDAVGLKSTSSVASYLKELEKEGYLRRGNSRSRALDLVEDDYETATNKDIAMIPVIGEIAAGSPILAVQNIEDHMALSADFLGSGVYFMLRVKGDSMINKGIFNKDYVLIKQQNTAENGEMVAALLDDSATVKTYYKENNRVRLQPENDALSPIYTQDVTILGIVKGVFRKL